MTQSVESQICIRFCIKLEHSSVENIQMIQKATAMGNWWVAASSQQRVHSCITSCTEFFGKTSNRLDDSATLQPRFGTLWLLAFPKTKITFEREEIFFTIFSLYVFSVYFFIDGFISNHQQDSGKYNREADVGWENCVRSPGACFEGVYIVIVLLYNASCILFSKCLYFS